MKTMQKVTQTTYATRHNKTGWVIAMLLCIYQPVMAQAQDKNQKLFWRSLECKEKPQVALYLETYPRGSYIGEAHACLEQSEKIHRQLLQCEAHLTANRLLTGQSGYALDCYKSVLQKDPGNARALAGITAIEDKYIAWIERALERHAAGRAERYLRKLKTLNTERAEIAQLARRINAEKQAEARRRAREAEKQRKAREDAARKKARQAEARRKAQEAEEWRKARQDAAQRKQREAEEQRKQREDAAQRKAQEAEERRKARQDAAKRLIDSLDFKAISAGSFRMGDLRDAGDDDEKPVHTVNISPFQMSTYEVTVGQFRVFVADSGYTGDAGNKCSIYEKQQWRGRFDRNWDSPGFTQDDTHPVVCVSYNDAQAFIRWLNAKTGDNYRLPTEAEWEYAARAGTTSRYSWGDNKSQAGAYAWYGKNSEGRTHAVGGKKPNPWGLYDMHGNVSEWVQDWHGTYHHASSPASNPQGPQQGTGRVFRGGDWHHPHDGGIVQSAYHALFLPGGRWDEIARDLRSAARSVSAPDSRMYHCGFRLVRQP